MEQFNQDRPIYLQISDRLCNEIIAGTYADDSRIPSVRDYAATLQVNANTAVKAYEQLSRDGIIYQRRGMGYYVTAGARDRIVAQRRATFLKETLARVFADMQLLDITIDDIIQEYRQFMQTEGTENQTNK